MLCVVDCVLNLGRTLVASASKYANLVMRSRVNDRLTKRSRVVIVGASFAGLSAQRALSHMFEVVLIDCKEFFEYTPGILRCYVDPAHLRHISGDLPQRNNRLVVGKVINIQESESCVTVQYPDGSLGAVPYDYLLLACGSSYTAPIKEEGKAALMDRQRSWAAASLQLKQAGCVIVVGGGPVGVELAAEIASKYPEKKVTLVSRSQNLCKDLPQRAISLVHKWLLDNGVELVMGISVQKVQGQACTLEDGQVLRADIVYECGGFAPNTACLGPGFCKHLDEDNRLKVNHHLQVPGSPRIYAMGDMMFHQASNDIKLGHTAELNAHVVAENVKRQHRGEELVTYPEGAVGASRVPRVFCVSLGKHAGVICFNQLVIGGLLPGPFKWLLEWTKVAACNERPVGELFWHIADYMTNILTRTLLPLPS